MAVDGEQSLPALRLPAEAVVRLVYGRLDPAHTPPVGSQEVDLDDLRPIFPGFLSSPAIRVQGDLPHPRQDRLQALPLLKPDQTNGQ
jgi:hypothetical protein